MTDRLIETVDARLERSLRDGLGARDPGAAPYGLRARVDRIPDAVEPSRANVRRAAATSLLAIAAVILIAVAVVPVARIGDAGPGAVPEATPAPSFDIDAEGYGVVPYVDISPVAFVIVGIALTGLVAAIVVARRRRRVLVAVVGDHARRHRRLVVPRAQPRTDPGLDHGRRRAHQWPRCLRASPRTRCST